MSARGTGALRRWALVVALVAVLASLPAVVGSLPAPDADVPAAELRAAVLASGDVAFTGQALSTGGLRMPVTGRFTAVADLFSDRTTMRVWWRGPREHRVDVLTPGGETGHHRDPAGGWIWEYEAGRVTRFGPGLVSLPAPPDVLPNALARRLLSEAAVDDLTRLGARRVAGRDALGLRLVPTDAVAAVSRVDVWADAATGLALQVQVYGADDAIAALDTRYLDVDLTAPDPAVLRFVPPPGAVVVRDQDRGVLEEAGLRLPRVALPGALVGLPRRELSGAPPAIGLYGRGVTLLAVVPVREELTGSLVQALRRSPGAEADRLGVRLALDPLALMVVDPPGPGAYVVTGTVTPAALAQAARELPAVGP